MKKGPLSLRKILPNILFILISIFWVMFRERPFVLKALRTLNTCGPLRFEVLLEKMGYRAPPSDTKHKETCPDDLHTIERLRLSALLDSASTGKIYMVYDKDHERCHHATFIITLSGQKSLSREK